MLDDTSPTGHAFVAGDSKPHSTTRIADCEGVRTPHRNPKRELVDVRNGVRASQTSLAFVTEHVLGAVIARCRPAVSRGPWHGFGPKQWIRIKSRLRQFEPECVARETRGTGATSPGLGLGARIPAIAVPLETWPGVDMDVSNSLSSRLWELCSPRLGIGKCRSAPDSRVGSAT
jgi:hypothetical protein